MKRTPLKRRTPVKKRNNKRHKAEFARTYGSKERCDFISRLPCAACGVVGYSENAHLLGNGGMGRKAGYETIGPLCGGTPARPFLGCHALYDEKRHQFDWLFPNFDPVQVADETEGLWLRRDQ